ncbi:EAL domain-containing protein [Methylomonas sp. AM2-LC]|uniref:EAL domain-containing response regulator n=1 Tax=Methylomonas sp. AM2-LC TaxID=3153301 RepID=UPI0032644774
MSNIDSSLMTRHQPVLLFVDDEPNVLKSLRRLFYQENYTIFLAESGADGLVILNTHAVDLILCDMRMPEMNGVEFLCEVVSKWPETIRILLTGYADLQSTIDAVNKGRIYNYCNKPWQDQELKLLVRNALEQKKLREERNKLAKEIVQKNAELDSLNKQLQILLEHRTQQLDVANHNFTIQQSQLNYQANYDELTGLINRHLLSERLQQIIITAESNQTQVCLFFLDIDNFKIINDTLGHSVGDELLKVTAQRLLTCTRAVDSVARYDGDGFVVILPEVAQLEEASRIAERIITEVSQPLQLSGHSLQETISIGISFYPQDGQTVEVLLQHADAAMYDAKLRGRNTFRFYTEELNLRLLHHMLLKEELCQALKDEQFVVFYQPKINLLTGNVSGVEALLRWQHPEKGIIPPDHFIPLAEELGLIVPMGEWVLKTACLQAKAWLDAGFPKITVAVNISPKQLHSATIIDTIVEVLSQSGLNAEYLDLEVTEGAVMQEPEKIVLTLNKLKALGIQISMDDFGTGYSSLSYLKRFPFDNLKIDKAFINDVTKNQEDENLVLTIIAMAHNFKLKVIAEGVETGDQVNFLRLKKCDEIQGYYFSRPLPANEVEILFVKNLYSLSESIK